jgi:hypothetical protein
MEDFVLALTRISQILEHLGLPQALETLALPLVSTNNRHDEINSRARFLNKEIKICLPNNLKDVGPSQTLHQHRNKSYKVPWLSYPKMLEGEAMDSTNKAELNSNKHLPWDNLNNNNNKIQ